MKLMQVPYQEPGWRSLGVNLYGMLYDNNYLRYLYD